MKKQNLILPLITVLLSSCVGVKTYGLEDYRTTMKFHDDFKVMQLTDLHFGVQGDFENQLKFVMNSIEYEDPDLIIYTGDNFMFASRGIVDNFIKTTNELCIKLNKNHPDRLTKFAITYGNHDRQGDYHFYYINEVVSKYVTEDGRENIDEKYASFLDYKDDNLSGLTNYYIDLVDDRTKSLDSVDVKYRLHIVDSNSYTNNGIVYDYDEIHQNQLDHMTNIYKNATKDQDYVGLCFFHIPFKQFDEAKEQYLNSSNKETIGQGEFKDKSHITETNTKSFRVMRDANIAAYFVGHDHMNYCDIIYNADSGDIMDKAIFSYGVKSTNQLYHDIEMIGYKIINLKEGMTMESFIDVNNIHTNFKNVIDRGDLYE